MQSALGAATAYAAAQQLLGHPHPFFAAVAAFVCLGLTDERRLRRVVELAAGVTLGVAMGDLFVLLAGSGALQVAVALAATVLVAVAVNGSQLVATQAGVQAVLVVALPPTAGSPAARWQDAFVGSAVAVAVAVLLPADPRGLARRRVAAVLVELAGILGALGDAVRRGDRVAAERTLDRARASQPLVDAAGSALRGAAEVTRIAPLRRRHRAEVAGLVLAGADVDRALRNARVVARRAGPAVEEGRALPAVADRLEALAEAAGLLAAATAAGAGATREAGQAERALVVAAGSLSPDSFAGDRHAAAVVALLRPLAVDLLEATGRPHAAARAELPVA